MLDKDDGDEGAGPVSDEAQEVRKGIVEAVCANDGKGDDAAAKLG